MAEKQENPAPKRAPSPAGQVVSGEDRDTVQLSAIVYENVNAKRSLSVHHVQRRLFELEYEMGWGRDGYYDHALQEAISAYQKDNGLADGRVDAETLESLFADDENVTISLA